MLKTEPPQEKGNSPKVVPLVPTHFAMPTAANGDVTIVVYTNEEGKRKD